MKHTGPKKASVYDYLNLRELNYWKKMILWIN